MTGNAGPRPAPPDGGDAAIARDVALTYRRRLRMAGSSHEIALEGAIARYLELRPEVGERLAASERVARIIANVVAVDPAWFWRGPEA